MKIKKVCQQCGKQFWSFALNDKPGRKRFCSLECRYNSQRGKFKLLRIEKICENCGKEFIFVQNNSHHKGRFCSRQCRNEYGSNRKYPREIIACQNCGKEFVVSSEQNRNGWENLFCSFQCALIFRRKSRTLICKNCGKKYLRISYCKRSRPSYCSRECMNEYRQNHLKREKVFCSYCGKKLIRKFSQIKGKKEHWCNMSCYLKKHPEQVMRFASVRNHVRGQRHPNFGRILSEIEKNNIRDKVMAHYDAADEVVQNFFMGQYRKYIPAKQFNELDEQIIKAKVLIFKLKRRLENEQESSRAVLVGRGDNLGGASYGDEGKP